MNSSSLTRRGFAVGALASTSVIAACNNGIGSTGAETIDARVDATLAEMFRRYPNTQDIADNANGMLVMPLVTEAGFGFGGAFGRGALRIDGITVDYYSLTEGSWGIQFGAQQYAHVLFFMTEDALANFRSSSGWAAGADIEYAFTDQGEGAGAATNTAFAPVIAVVFGRAGLFAGASLTGNKYTRIIP